MNVKELIEILETMDPEAEVLWSEWSHAHERDTFCRVSTKQEPIHRDSLGYPIPTQGWRLENDVAAIFRRSV